MPPSTHTADDDATKLDITDVELQKKAATKEAVDIFSKLLKNYNTGSRYKSDYALQSFQIPTVLTVATEDESELGKQLLLNRLKDPRFGLRRLETAYVVTVEDKEVFSPKSKVAKLQTFFPRILERISMK